jgi:hypothetical protein
MDKAQTMIRRKTASAMHFGQSSDPGSCEESLLLSLSQWPTGTT